MASNAAVAPFPAPPRYYEDFEPHSNTEFQCPPPPPPLEGSYVMYGKLYDTSFSPQDPAVAHRERGLDLEVEDQSPVAMLRLLNRLLPDEYLKLMQLMIDRPVLCRNETDQQKIKDLDQQRDRVEKIIEAMHVTLSRFRPYQARQALITALRAQVERRQKEAKELRECRERAQDLIKNASGQLKEAKDALALAQATEVSAQQALSAAGKSSASVGMLSLQPQAVAAPPAPAGSAAAPAAVEGAQAAGQVDVKPSNTGEADGGAGAGYPAAQESVRKRRRTSDLISKLDSISRDIPSQTPVQVPAAE